MPYTEQHKQRSREKIITSAITLFMNKGYDNVTIDELMADAGLTRGAFYAHFKSKGELYGEAILSAAHKSPVREVRQSDSVSEKERLHRVIDLYLSSEHVSDDGYCCPLAFLSTDIANRDPGVRHVYTQVYRKLSKLMERDSDSSNEDSANWAVAALMIGGVAVCRALNEEDTVEQVLHACRETAKQLV